MYTKDSSLKAYVIECENGNYYVGITDSLEDAWFHHINGIEAVWTRKHRPLKVIKVINDAESYDEFCLIKLYMAKYGIQKVRGGNYWQENLSEDQILILQTSIKEEKDKDMNAISELCNQISLE